MKNNFRQLSKMKAFAFIVIVFFFCSKNSIAQTPVNVGINYTGASANPYALLDLDAAGYSKGLLIPRMASAARTAMTFTVSAQGLTVYQTDGTQGFYYNTSSTTTPNWVRLGGAPISLTSDVTGVLPIANGGTNNSLAYSSGSILYSNGTSATQDNSNLFWDASNHRLGLKTISPSGVIDVIGQTGNRIVIDYNGAGDNYIQAAGNIHFNTTGSFTERMTILQNGNVGISTTNPGQTLHVVGLNGFPANSGTAQTGIARFQPTGGNGVLDFGSNSGSGVWLQSTNQTNLALTYPLLLNPNGGNVGIGTTLPLGVLTIQKWGASASAEYPLSIVNETPGSASNSSVGMSFVLGGNSTESQRAEQARITVKQNYYGVRPSFNIETTDYNSPYTTWYSRLFIDPQGNVGIGTTSPSTKFVIEDANGIPLRFGDLAAAPSSQTAGYIGMSTSAYTGRNGDLILFPRTSSSCNILLMGGNVGIGTTSPGSLLSNTSTTDGNVTANGFTWLTANTDNYVTYLKTAKYGLHVKTTDATSASFPFVVSNSSSTLFSILGNGNVGIGTTSPNALFQVTATTPEVRICSGSDNFAPNIFSHNTGYANDNFSFAINSAPSTSNSTVTKQTSGYSSSRLRLYTTSSNAATINFETAAHGSTSWNTRMAITSDGSVGIGTTSPSSLFSVGSSSQFQVNSSGNIAKLNNVTTSFPSSQGSAGTLLQNDGSGTLSWADPAGLGVKWNALTTPTGNLSIDHAGYTTAFTFNSVTTANAFALSSSSISSGTVLDLSSSSAAGTASSSSKVLNISRSGTNSNSSHTAYGLYSSVANTGTTSTNVGGYFSASGASTNYGIKISYPGASTNNYAIYCDADAKSYFSGDVGIGTSSPSYKLQVQSDNVAKTTAGSWLGYSDQRLKKNIVAFNDGLAVLRQVNPISYEFTGVGNMPVGKTFIGVAAQDIKQVAPYCVVNSTLRVKQSDNAAFSGDIIENIPAHDTVPAISVVNALMYNYDGLIYVLINSVKELDKENSTLKTELDDLKARLEALEKK